MYHSVGDNEEFFTVPKKEFDCQMKYLSENNFNVVSVSELVELVEKKLLIPVKTIAITFDDGYEDNYLNALPILNKYNFPATIFVSTANLGKVVVGRMGTELKTVSAEEIQEISKGGLVQIGSHSHDHTKLPSLSTAEVREQLVTSQNILRDILDKDIDFIAYPSGKVNDGVKEIAKEYFRAGFGVQKGRVVWGDDKMTLKRNSVDSRVSFWQFKGIAVFGRI